MSPRAPGKATRQLTEAEYLELQARHARSAIGVVGRECERSVTAHPRLGAQLERHPWLAMAGGVTAGVVAGRLLGPLARALRSALVQPGQPDGGNGDRPGRPLPSFSSTLATVLGPT